MNYDAVGLLAKRSKAGWVYRAVATESRTNTLILLAFSFAVSCVMFLLFGVLPRPTHTFHVIAEICFAIAGTVLMFSAAVTFITRPFRRVELLTEIIERYGMDKASTVVDQVGTHVELFATNATWGERKPKVSSPHVAWNVTRTVERERVTAELASA